jgi:hypothetical protein
VKARNYYFPCALHPSQEKIAQKLEEKINSPSEGE